MISVQKLSINLKVAIFMLMILEVRRMIKNIGSYKQSLEIEDKNLKKKKKNSLSIFSFWEHEFDIGESIVVERKFILY